MVSMALGVLLHEPGELTVTSGYLVSVVVPLHLCRHREAVLLPSPSPSPSCPSLRLTGRPAAAVAEAAVL